MMKSFQLIVAILIISITLSTLFQNCSNTKFKSTNESSLAPNNDIGSSNLVGSLENSNISLSLQDWSSIPVAQLSDLKLLNKPVRPICPDNFNLKSIVKNGSASAVFLNQDPHTYQSKIISIPLPSIKDYQSCLDELLQQQERALSCGNFNIGSNISCIVEEGGNQSELINKKDVNLTMALGTAIDSILKGTPSSDPTIRCQAKVCLTSYQLPTSRDEPKTEEVVKVVDLPSNFNISDKVITTFDSVNTYSIKPEELISVIEAHNPFADATFARLHLYTTNISFSPLKVTAGNCGLFNDGTVSCNQSVISGTLKDSTSNLYESDPNIMNCGKYPYYSYCSALNKASKFIGFSRKVVDITDSLRKDSVVSTERSGVTTTYKATNLICAVLDNQSIECAGEMVYSVASMYKNVSIKSLSYESITTQSFQVHHFPKLDYMKTSSSIDVVKSLGGLPRGAYLAPGGTLKDLDNNSYGIVSFVTQSGFLINNQSESFSVLSNPNGFAKKLSYHVLDFMGADDSNDNYVCLLGSNNFLNCSNLLPERVMADETYKIQHNFSLDLSKYGISK